eukprot:5454763-Prymnesium_polylepis.1
MAQRHKTEPHGDGQKYDEEHVGPNLYDHRDERESKNSDGLVESADVHVRQQSPGNCRKTEEHLKCLIWRLATRQDDATTIVISTDIRERMPRKLVEMFDWRRWYSSMKLSDSLKTTVQKVVNSRADKGGLGACQSEN